MFSEAVERIEREYGALGHQLGWRFLYSPAKTLSVNTRILFIGKNPGGSSYVSPIASVEEGNAYRVERWGKHNAYNPLQGQVHKLFGVLSQKLGRVSATDLMDDTLTSNFCPFRSSGWSTLHRKSESLSFSVNLWSWIFDHVSPTVIICNGTPIPYTNIRHTLLTRGYKNKYCNVEPVGWHTYTYMQALCERHDGQVLTAVFISTGPRPGSRSDRTIRQHRQG